MKVAVIDIGTNSTRLDIRDLSNDGTQSEILTDRVILRLGRSVFQTGSISPEALVTTFDAMEKFTAHIESAQAEKVIAVGTSALREAENGPDIIRKIHERFGIDIQVISGRREAALIARGVLGQNGDRSDDIALIDIGGGSTEITLCRKGTIEFSESFPLGALRMQEIFLKTVPPSSTELRNPIAQLRHHVRAELSSHIVLDSWPSPAKLIGSSGTVKSIAKLGKAADQNLKLIRATELRRLIQQMTPLDAENLMKIPGMEKKRTEIILSGALLLDEILNLFRAEEIEISEFTLRDGLFAEAFETIDANRSAN